MCFFKKNKLIAPNLNITNHELILPQKLHRKGLRLDTKLIVPRNFAFVLFAGGVVLDCFLQGEYNLTVRNLPKTSKKLNLYNGNFKKTKKFAHVEAYFINLNDFDNNIWQTTKKVELENKEFGVYKFFASGKYNFKITFPELFLQHLKSELQTITPETAKTMLENSINKIIYEKLYEKNYAPEKLFELDKEITADLANEIDKILKKIGLHLSEFTFERTLFPPKIQKELEKKEFAKKLEENTSGKTETNKNKFVTIERTAPGSKNFFKESMAPYFFTEDETEESQEKQKPQKVSKWIGVLEQEELEKQKSFVNLNTEEDNN
ncbi:MAG: SPFH domain-containing protein [Clostridia bacterium]|nr:SPFH domain-containing protein [Clostridia bacterium]